MQRGSAPKLASINQEFSMDSAQQEWTTNFGSSIVNRLVAGLGASQVNEFPQLLDIKNLAGASTGYVHVYKAPRLIKATHLSVNVAPGARYFNIHIVPEVHYNVPRYSLEGMVTSQGSQVSMDMYPDIDTFMDIRPFLEQMSGVCAVYDEAKKTDIDFRPSRLPHMRAFCSPFFLNVFKATSAQLPQLDAIANRYFDEWIKIFQVAPTVDAIAAANRQRRRTHMSDTVIALDPDRQMIVQVYGEAITCAIEQAVMYW
jgi:hypothetical protein